MKKLSELDPATVFPVQIGHDGGSFTMTSCIDRGIMRVIASFGMGWDHVSVSRSDSCPVWEEMEQVKRAFFRDHETAMQLHVPPADHLSVHPNCLHLWRPQGKLIPRPPAIMVARPGDAERLQRSRARVR